MYDNLCTSTQKSTKNALENDIPLSDTVLVSVFSDQAEKRAPVATCSDSATEPLRIGPDGPVGDRPFLPVSRARLCDAQRADPMLKECFSKMVTNSNATDE